MTPDDIRDLAVLHSAGLLDEEETRAFENRLRAGDETAKSELLSFRETAAQISFALPALNSGPAVRTRLMDRIQAQESEPLPGIHVLRASPEGWRSTAYPGVTYKPLYLDRATEMATSLLRLEPGAKYPMHRHTADEQCLVVDGEVRIGELVLRSGDFEWAQAQTVHSILETERGCVLLIVGSRRDEILL